MIVPKTNLNAPLENKVIIVAVQNVMNQHGFGYEAVEVEHCLDELKIVAEQSGRQVTMVNFFVTAGGTGVIVTILVQWIGKETLEKQLRLQQIQNAQQPTGRMH